MNTDLFIFTKLKKYKITFTRLITVEDNWTTDTNNLKKTIKEYEKKGYVLKGYRETDELDKPKI